MRASPSRSVIDSGSPVPRSGRLDLRRRAARLQGDRRGRRRRCSRWARRSSCARMRCGSSSVLDWFEPSARMTFVVHLDGMREIHDYVCDYPGLWEIAVDAIKTARARGFRVTTNTTIFKETEVEDVIEMMRYLTDEVGIDGMLIAPGYQYSQIDPALTMTRAGARGEVPRHPRGGTQARLPLDRHADLPGLPHRRAQAVVCAVGLDHAQPVRLEGPVLPAHRRHLPDVRSAARRHGVGGLRPGQRSRAASTAASTPASSRRRRSSRRSSLKETVRSMAWTLTG